MRPRLWASLLVLGVLLLGCSDDKKKPEDPEPDPYMKQTSITNCLFNLKLAYNQQDMERYRALLHDAYTYVFSPQDAGHANIPDSWGKADEILSATHLFGGLPNLDGFVCQTVSLNFMAGADVVSAIDPSWRDVRLSQIQLLLDCVHQGTEEPLRYEMLGDQADLSFVQTAEIDPDSGLKLWKIIMWVDRPVNFKTGTKQTTWGKIKASWR
jgi:hypothetical protein